MRFRGVCFEKSSSLLGAFLEEDLRDSARGLRPAIEFEIQFVAVFGALYELVHGFLFWSGKQIGQQHTAPNTLPVKEIFRGAGYGDFGIENGYGFRICIDGKPVPKTSNELIC